MPTIYPSRNRRVVPKSEKPNAANPSRWYSREYLAGVWAQRPAKFIALLGFVVIVGLLIIAFAASPELTVWSSPTDFNNAVSKSNVSVNSDGTVTLKAAGLLPNTDDGTLHRADSLQEDGGAFPNDNCVTASNYARGKSADGTKQYGSLDAVTTGNSLSGCADSMIAANANLLLMPYEKSVHYTSPTLSPYNNLGFPESWFAHDANGNPVQSPFTKNNPANKSHVWVMQPDSTASWTSGGITYSGFEDWNAKGAIADINRLNKLYATASNPSPRLWRGGWFDSAGSFSFINQVVPGTKTLYFLSTWESILNQALSTIKTKLVAAGNADSFANGIDTNAGLATSVDGVMFESWLRNPTQDATVWPDDNNGNSSPWRKDLQTVMTSQTASGQGAYTQVLSKIWDSATYTFPTSAVEPWRRYLVASAFLANQGKLLFELDVKQQTPWSLSYGPSYQVTLGTPLTTQTTPAGYCISNCSSTTTGKLYKRAYQKGIVYLNTSSASISTDLGGTYTDLDGNVKSGTVTIPAHSGVIYQN